MSKIIGTNQIVDPSIGQPFTGPTLAFAQQSYTEGFDALASAAVGDKTAVTILQGCSYTFVASANTFTISSGSTYFNGQLYNVPATVVTTGGTDTVVVGMLNVSDPIGPVIFSDGNARTVFQNRQIVPTAGVSGAGISSDAKSDFLN